MASELELLLDRYETGRLSRRELLCALAAIALPSPAAETKPAIGVARQLNHATVFVQDVVKSRTFYQKLFGMPVLTHQDPGVNLAVGTGFIGLYPAPAGEQPRIDHVCLGLEHFDAESTRKALAGEGVDAIIRARGETKELYFADPDGIRIQLQDVKYRGGVGPLGDRNPK